MMAIHTPEDTTFPRSCQPHFPAHRCGRTNRRGALAVDGCVSNRTGAWTAGGLKHLPRFVPCRTEHPAVAVAPRCWARCCRQYCCQQPSRGVPKLPCLHPTVQQQLSSKSDGARANFPGDHGTYCFRDHGNIQLRIGNMGPGAQRHCGQLYQDAMAIATKYGQPDMLLTIIFNPKWPEIVKMEKLQK
jgi:Helitron helicase-like domain at N-terminus